MVFAVELRKVSKHFGDVEAVHQVSLQIRDGEFFSLLGPSGCGKTTTLRMIAGFERPTEGEIYIKGERMNDVPPFHRPVNTVFQHYALFPHMTVFENVAFGLEMKRLPRDEIRRRVEEALRLVRLTGLENRYPRQLSGGQQQRVALARALVNRPAVLLLDEPLGALDLKLRKEMQLELKTLQHQVGITFIYVTHDQEEAMTMSDRIAVMNQGRVLQVGTPVEIYEHPATRFVADFIGETNFLEGRVVDLERGMARVEIEGFTVFAAPSEGTHRGQRVTVAVRPERIRLGAEGPEDTPNRYPGVIEEVIYIGTDTLFRVRVGERLGLRVRMQNRDGSASIHHYRPGAVIWVAWLPESARVLTE
ncbi:Spermidine/putrescine import ATP-binding protein PotA [Candidatus Thermoflexus japonica]|uniref:Spermidine/putrescine import ATP-binding protein PotA n=1 Tax=Candidatus Thermoflexus japonica TaxID=2035417 RepID=A0A2H5Y779_9CHLR|nr:Spermidine/putrescine import ATP-binding protein PotA [Candidatus Thermoflexus japonica]